MQVQYHAFIFIKFHQLLDLLKGGIELKSGIEQVSIILNTMCVYEYPIPNNTQGRTLVKGRKLDHV